MATRGSIDVDLDPDQAIELVAASFAAARGWVIERRERALSIWRMQASDYYFGAEPGPSANILQGGVGLALDVEARPLADGGAHVRAQIVRRDRLVLSLSLVGFVAADLAFYFGLHSLFAGLSALERRRNHRGGKRRLVALAIEPLLPHQRTSDPGPFRRGR